ncbi:phenylalanine--tRNA ligase subunit beta, partial [candidate division NPL-UPA2 bacterium]|nr:phenylalanine--tRNA ligase subunit beta [candidate division NPL-UPA2 bacterium]
SLINMQEKLGETLGRRRSKVAIGIYEAGSIEFPVRYGAFDPLSYKFIPLEFSVEMTLKDILKKHPKGIEYGRLLEGGKCYPLLLDARDEVLSLPPIINSQKLGEVKPGASELFVEATGTDQKAVVLALNIISSAFSLRGGTIERGETVYPYATPLGENQVTPRQMNKALSIDGKELRRILGMEISGPEAADCLRQLGYEIQGQGEKFQVIAPYYRSDCMHEYDIIEDIAIVRGYDNFSPLPLSDFTVGALSEEQEIIDKIREIIVGMGFQEIISNALMDRRELEQWMRGESGAIEVDNVMTETYSVLRNGLIPGLLKVERESSQIEYPHKIFEVGEVALKENGSREEIRLAVLISGREAGFTDIHRVLESLMEELSYPYELKEAHHNSFIEGRCGEVESGGRTIGMAGEIHPEVLSRWAIKMPVSALEITLNKLSSATKSPLLPL